MDERPNPICSHCGQMIETDDYSFVHGEIVCHECVESDCSRCERCGELIFDEDAYGDDNHTLCRNCYDNYYTRCDNCDCVVHTSQYVQGLGIITKGTKNASSERTIKLSAPYSPYWH